MNNTFLVRGESVCLEIGFGKVKLVRLGESGRVAHKVGAVFTRAVCALRCLRHFSMSMTQDSNSPSSLGRMNRCLAEKHRCTQPA